MHFVKKESHFVPFLLKDYEMRLHCLRLYFSAKVLQWKDLGEISEMPMPWPQHRQIKPESKMVEFTLQIGFFFFWKAVEWFLNAVKIKNYCPKELVSCSLTSLASSSAGRKAQAFLISLISFELSKFTPTPHLQTRSFDHYICSIASFLRTSHFTQFFFISTWVFPKDYIFMPLLLYT